MQYLLSLLHRPRTPPAPDLSPLANRLHALGLSRSTVVTTTRNRTVMLSWNRQRGLRIHEGYAAAPDEVLLAVVGYLQRRSTRASRAAMRARFLAFPAHLHGETHPPRARRSKPPRPEDESIVQRLQAAHAELNARYFEGSLATIPIFLSSRMQRRLGELRAPKGPDGPEITMSRRHLRRDGWDAALDTLLHEMVHQWQAETGRSVDHGADFRRKARAVGISPRAIVDLRR